MAEFEVAITFEGEVAIVGLHGRLDRETSSILETVGETLLDATSGIVFDFEHVGVVDDFGVDGLERCMKHAVARGLHVGFRNTRRDGASITARYGIEDVSPLPTPHPH